jgi:lysozyme
MTTTQKQILISVAILAFLAYCINRFVIHKNMKMYPNFGIQIPMGFDVHGIDVSKYQKDINWELVSKMRDKGAKLDFAIIKSTEGNYLRDRCFEENWEQSKENNLIRGAYLYFHPNANGATQALYYIKNTPLKNGDLAPIIDIEETNGQSNKTIEKQLQDCIATLKNKFDAEPIIYCNADFYTAHLSPAFDNYPLWVAHYNEASPRVNRSWQLWQHNDGGTVNGIDAKVDFNVANGSVRDLMKLTLQ